MAWFYSIYDIRQLIKWMDEKGLIVGNKDETVRQILYILEAPWEYNGEYEAMIRELLNE